MKNYILFALCFISVCSSAQTITTIAGNGTSGFSGDGGPATSANLSTGGWGIGRDAAGNVYVADFSNNRVRKIDPSGIITTFAGNGSGYSGDGGPATAAGIGGPTGIVTYGTDVYIAENFSSRIRKVDAAGIITTYAGNGIIGFSGDGGPATDAEISNPNGLGIDNLGNIYIPDQATNHIRKVTTSGIISTIAGNGAAGYTGDGGPATDATMRLPDDVTTDASGNVYVCDFNNSVIRKVSTSGIISTVAGTGVSGFSGDGGPATAAELSGPGGVYFDAAGNMYIGDSYNNRIRMVNTSGVISTVAGTGVAGFAGDGGPALLAEFNKTNKLVIDPVGNLYLTDMNNDRVRKVTVVFANTPPSFTGGNAQSLIFCQILETTAPRDIDSLLAISDPDAGQTETWSLLTAPGHGTAAASYTATATGAEIIPSGLTYTSLVGYSGNDSFKVRATDGIASDTITIYVTINPLPQVGAIAGPSVVCIGESINLFDTSASGVGIWGESNTNGSIGAGGMVTGLHSGVDTFTYSVASMCGVTLAKYPVTVQNCDKSAVGSFVSGSFMHLFPNPVASGLSIEWGGLNAGEGTIIIRNITGQQVFCSPTMKIGPGNDITQIDLGQLANGVYLFSFTSASFYYTDKVVISR